MTAINVFRSPGALHVFTDGAVVNQQSGVLTDGINKAEIFPFARAVVAASGPYGMTYSALAGLQAVAAEMVGYEAMVERAPDTVRKQLRDHSEFRGQENLIALLFAGFTRHGRPEVYLLHNCPGWGEDLPPWTMIPRTSSEGDVLWASPVPPDAHEQLYGERFKDAAAARQRGLALMRQQRRLPPVGACKVGSSVGAWCQMSTITEHEITTKILERWGDRVGEPLGATKAFQ